MIITFICNTWQWLVSLHSVDQSSAAAGAVSLYLSHNLFVSAA